MLAGYGVGSAVASLVTGALPMPRRYLTIMNAMWGLACLPLLVVAVTSSVPAIAVAMFAVGVLMSAPMVPWGTLLQRRVPPELLGRASSGRPWGSGASSWWLRSSRSSWLPSRSSRACRPTRRPTP